VSPADTAPVGGGERLLSPTPAARVVLEDVRHVYGRGRRATPVLTGMQLSIADGEFVAVLGPSGCGKSTLLRLIAGLEVPAAGRITVAGSAPVVGRGVGVVFQQPRLFPWRTVAGNVAFGLGRAPGTTAAVDAAMARVGLAGLGGRRIWELSGGQQQRVALARTLVTGPQLLLMDEPFAALDAITRERLQDELRRMAITDGVTTVFVTHSVDEAVLLASRVLVMAVGGRIAADMPVPLARRADDSADDVRASAAFTTTRRVLSGVLAKVTG
jgi:taurine transport system ATP-binding protein